MISERVCAECPRREACPGTMNRTCLQTAVKLVDQLTMECVQAAARFDKALADIKAERTEGRCGCCAHNGERDAECWAADLDCTNCAAECMCRTCEAGSNWRWDK